MENYRPGARWQQLRTRALESAEGRQNYQAGFQQAQTYRDTMRLLDGLRRALGISQSELARRLEKKQPTIARLLAHGENPTLGTVDEVLRALGFRARIVIEVGEATGDALTVQVKR